MARPDVPAPRSPGAGLPTARSRIRASALELFAAHGVDRTTVRAIAAHAAVSPALVLHHYGSKQALRREVDAAVAQRFADAITAADDARGADPLDRITRSMAAVLADPAVRAYLRRELCDGAAAGQQLFDRLYGLVHAELAELENAGVVRRGTDPHHRTCHVLYLVLGPLAFAPLLAKHHPEMDESEAAVAARGAATLDLLRNGLFETGQLSEESGRGPAR